MTILNGHHNDIKASRPPLMNAPAEERAALPRESLAVELETSYCIIRLLEDRLRWYADVQELLSSGKRLPAEALRSRGARSEVGEGGGPLLDHNEPSSLVDLNAGVYRGFFNAQDVAVLRHAGNQLVDCNDACLRMFGLASVEELRSLGCASTLSPEFQPDGQRSSDLVARMAMPVMDQGFSHFTWYHQRRSGAVFPAEVFIYRMGDKSSVNYQSIVRDLTEEKATERRLRRQQLAMEQAFDGMCIVSADGILTYVNPAFDRMLRGVTLGRPLAELLSADDAVRASECLLRARRDGNAWKGEMRARRVDGSEELFALALTLTPLDSDEALLVCRDVSEEVAQRARLDEALKFEAMGQAAGALAHDFNNILRAVHFAAEGYLERQSPDAAREAMGRILECTGRATEWISQVLSLGSRGDTGSQDKETLPAAVEVHAAVTSVVRLLPSHLRADHVLETRCEATRTLARGDASSLERALLNLCLNARDAMPAGGRLTIKTHNTRLEGAPGIAIEVSDTGTGMEERVRARIFEPFFSTKGTTGRGLGLAFVHKATLTAGGTVEVESSPEKGTTFRLVFPTVDTVSTPARRSVYPPAALKGKFGSLSHSPKVEPNLRDAPFILVVDDDVHFRIAVTDALLAAGRQVLTDDSVTSAKETLARFGERIGVVLSDLNLPDGSGEDVLTQSREVSPHARRILMSSSFTPSDETVDDSDAQKPADDSSESVREPTWSRLSKLSPLTRFLSSVAP